ncbi:SAM-dependent methyltransferase [Thermocladium modestius]|uniref:SAM-dependent methyltransferase n=1 Tax=Thermocladium modestius TaxID=62609 RepID=A0A830GXW0_9CREN|nr:class I SAM-dependent methyltransferase [Thermocladium modestius]GGP22454.1 SAM-dependent methyltransferase [Thermocladium modestius]
MFHGRHGAHWGSFRSPELEKLIEETMNHVEAAADLGCGEGRFCGVLSRHADKVYCVDADADAIEAARGSAAGGNAVFLVEDAGRTSIPSGEVGVVLMVNSFHDMQDKRAVAREVYRILRDGGRALIIEFKPGVGGFGPPSWIRMKPGEVAEILGEAGLRLERIDEVGNQNALLFRKQAGAGNV